MTKKKPTPRKDFAQHALAAVEAIIGEPLATKRRAKRSPTRKRQK